MIRPNQSWQYMPLLALILVIVGCSHEGASTHTPMMAADTNPGTAGVEKRISQQPIPMPHEPLLFKMPNDSPAASMLEDSDTRTPRISAPSMVGASKPKPIPSEPTAQ